MPTRRAASTPAAVSSITRHSAATIDGCGRRINPKRPSAVICHTVKGKGFPFAEHDPDWHHKSRVPSDLGRQLYAALEHD